MKTSRKTKTRKGVMMKETIPLASWLDHLDGISKRTFTMQTQVAALWRPKTDCELQKFTFEEKVATGEFRARWLDLFREHICIDENDEPKTLRECLEVLRKFLIKCWLELRIFIIIARRETASSDDLVTKPLTVAKPKLAFPKRTLFALPLSCHVLRMNNQLLL